MSADKNTDGARADVSRSERAKAAVQSLREHATSVGGDVAERVRDRLEDSPLVDRSPAAKAKRAVRRRSTQALAAAKERRRTLSLIAVVLLVVALLIVARARNGTASSAAQSNHEASEA